jgi:hypothetical protein
VQLIETTLHGGLDEALPTTEFNPDPHHPDE